MAEEKQKDKEEFNTLSNFEKNIKHLFDEVDDKLEQIGGDFSPILMQELQNRLEKIIKNFNEEVNDLFKKSFKKWKITDTQLREFVDIKIKLPKNKEKIKEKVDENTPSFIREVKFGPLRPK